MLSQVCLPAREIADAADFMLQTIDRHAGGEYRLFKADLRKRKRERRPIEMSLSQ
jgi:hypothetical protein